MKRAQISLEVLYSVGIMIIVFLILSGISFNRKVEVDRLDRFLERKTECYHLSNVINGVQATGENTLAVVKVKYYTDIQTNGVIIVKEYSSAQGGIQERTVEAYCTFHASVTSVPTGGELVPEQSYEIKNVAGVVTIA